MSVCIEDQGLFHVEVYHVASAFKLGFEQDGTLRVEVGSDVRSVRLTPTDAKALRVWLQAHEEPAP